MSGHTDVALREVQGIYQGLAPWAAKGVVTPRFIEAGCGGMPTGRAHSNNCAMVHKDVVHNWLDNCTLRIGFVVQSKVL